MDGWKSVSAVRKGRIYYVESDWLMRPGPRLIDALEQMAALFHPGEFKEP
jgi:iron complex transport system substrate-binding protein